MPTLTVSNDTTFHYTDSGSPNDDEYSTIFIIHGHTFHSGTFRQLFPLAASRSLRVICIDRREYQGSTPHTPEELRVINHGSQDERAKYIADQGVLLALLIDGLFQSLNLPIKGGGALAGWSMGNIYTLAVINAIGHPKLPQEAKERLKAFIRTFILWDAPSMNLGIEDPPKGYLPLWDNDLPEDARAPATAKYIASFFDHDEDAIAARDVSRLNYRTPSPQAPTMEKMTLEVLFSITDFPPGPKCENIISDLSFIPVHRANVHKAFFDSDSNMSNWEMDVWCIYGSKSHWPMIYAAWDLEEKDRISNRIKFRPVEGANHFLMWEDPDLAINVLKMCIEPKWPSSTLVCLNQACNLTSDI